MANKKLLATIVNLNNIVIITDDLVPKKYVENLYYIFDNAAIELIMLNAGESNKNLLAIESIINKLITFKRSICNYMLYLEISGVSMLWRLPSTKFETD